MSVILIVYVASRSVIFALERSSFAVIVMFRVSPKVASEVLCLCCCIWLDLRVAGSTVSIILQMQHLVLLNSVTGYHPYAAM